MSLLNAQVIGQMIKSHCANFLLTDPQTMLFSSIKNGILPKKCNTVSINHHLSKCMLLRSYLKKYQRNMLLSSSVIHYFSCIRSQYVNLKRHAYWTGSGHLSGPFINQLSSMASSPQCSSSLQSYLTKLKEKTYFTWTNFDCSQILLLLLRATWNSRNRRNYVPTIQRPSGSGQHVFNPCLRHGIPCVNTDKTHHFPKPHFLRLLQKNIYFTGFFSERKKKKWYHVCKFPTKCLASTNDYDFPSFCIHGNQQPQRCAAVGSMHTSCPSQQAFLCLPLSLV